MHLLVIAGHRKITENNLMICAVNHFNVYFNNECSLSVILVWPLVAYWVVAGPAGNHSLPFAVCCFETVDYGCASGI